MRRAGAAYGERAAAGPASRGVAPALATSRSGRRSGHESGPPRCRAAILAAARERFAADRYEHATVRAVAKDASIDPSMVTRHFGNEEGLFAAAADFDFRLPEVTHFLDRWESDGTLTAVAERLKAIVQQQLAAGRRPRPCGAVPREAALTDGACRRGERRGRGREGVQAFWSPVTEVEALASPARASLAAVSAPSRTSETPGAFLDSKSLPL